MNKTVHLTKYSGYIADTFGPREPEDEKKDTRMMGKLVGLIIAGFLVAIILVFGTAWIVMHAG